MTPSSSAAESRIARRLDAVNVGLAVAVFVSFGFSLAPTPAPGTILPLIARPTATLASAVERSDVLMTRSVTLEVQTSDGVVSDDVSFALSDHPSWIIFDETDYSFSLDEEAIAEVLRSHPLFTSATARVYDAQKGWVLQGTVEGTARAGWTIDHEQVAHVVAKALLRGH